MKNILKFITKPENVLSYSLGFVIIWFGFQEVFSPQDWITFLPPFLGDGSFANNLVVFHGIILTVSALLLFFNIYRKIVAIILTFIFLEIIITLIAQTGLSDIAVRDIGLLGMIICLILLTFQRTKEVK